MHRVRSVLAAALIAMVCLGVSPAAAADLSSAGQERCAGTFYATGGRELFEVPAEYLPAPLRSHPADCASRPTGQIFDGGPADYTLFYVDIAFDDVVAIFRSLESGGWNTVDTAGTIDTGTGSGIPNPDLTSAELAALTAVPTYVGAAFSQGTPDSLVLTYTDGLEYDNDSSLDVPSMTINVHLLGPLTGTGVDDPSVLSSLHPFVPPTPVQSGVIAGGAVVLMLVVGWPASLLNSVVGSRYDGFVRWLQRRREKKPTRRLPGWLMWPGFAVAALLGAFVDPDFGWNAMSARVVVTLFLSFVLFNLATWTLVRAVARRIQPDSKPVLRFRWGTLFIVAFAVLIARLLQLEPGIIFGLVAGVAYATALRARNSALIALLGAGFGLALALIAWTVYSLLAPAAAGTDSVPLILVTEFLAGVTVKGVSSLPLALLPLGSLDGAKVAKWRRVAWAVAYTVGLAAFMLVLLTIPKAWGEVPGDFLRWLLIFGAYAVVVLVIWIIHTALVKRKPPKETPIGEQPDAITLD